MHGYVICNDWIFGRLLSNEELIFVVGEILCMLSLCLCLVVSTYPLFTLIASNNDKSGASYVQIHSVTIQCGLTSNTANSSFGMFCCLQIFGALCSATALQACTALRIAAG